MTLPPSGQISLSQVNTELGYSSTASITMNDSAVRTLFGVSSGAISMSNGWGKANAWAGTITSNQSNLNLRTWATGAGWNGSSKATITVNAGVWIWATTTGTAGMTINGSWPGGCFLVNNGNIIGKGGGQNNDTAGEAGGPAISLGVNCTITNNSYIAGGGGRQQCGGVGYIVCCGSGGGAGGGMGGCPGPSGQGGSIGASGTPGTISGYNWAGGGGGRILPGSGGSKGSGNTPGSWGPGQGGGSGGGSPSIYWNFGGFEPGGDGGSANNPGQTAPNLGGGGGWGASSGGSTNSPAGYPAFPGGNAVKLNGYTVTWVATGTRYGAIS